MRAVWWFLGLLSCCLLVMDLGVHSAPIGRSKRDAAMTNRIAKRFLRRFGYLTEDRPSSSQYRQALKEYQRFNGLEQSGQLDDDTKIMMLKPRCGVPDIHRESRRKKRYVTFGMPWTTDALTIKYINYTPDLGEAVTKSEIDGALTRWSSVSPLSFSETSGDAHIDILFASGAHGDGVDFDGPGTVLAHAWAPDGNSATATIHGDMHFDEDEPWTDSSANFNLEYVAAHELGHSLGLDHTTVPGNLMLPIYAYNDGWTLGSDDVLGIQCLYGDEDGDPVSGCNGGGGGGGGGKGKGKGGGKGGKGKGKRKGK